MTFNNIVIFSIDVGIHGHNWIRLELSDQNVSALNTLFIPSSVSEILVNSGNDLNAMGNLLISDLNNKRKVAISIEAPLWHFNTSASPTINNCYIERFPYETTAEWYNIGASATLKSLPIMNFIISIMNQNSIASYTTNLHNWKSNSNLIYLFEGFVVKSFKPYANDFKNVYKIITSKTKKPKQNSKTIKKNLNKDELDAFVSALAFYIEQFNAYHILKPNYQHLSVKVISGNTIEQIITNSNGRPSGVQTFNYIHKSNKKSINRTVEFNNPNTYTLSIATYIHSYWNESLFKYYNDPLSFNLEPSNVYGIKFR